MWHSTVELIYTGFKSLFLNPNGFGSSIISGITTYVIIPCIVVCISFLYKIQIQESLVSDILTILSIFLAITLGVIFIVPDKLTKRFVQENSQNESDKNAKIRYRNFCKLFIQRLSFILVLSVILIVATIIMKVSSDKLLLIFSSLVMGMFTMSILCILKLIVDIYIFLMDDISRIQ